MLPDMVHGALPPGIHPASWEDVLAVLGWNPWRRQLLHGLRRALDALAAAGCRQTWLDGSFVTTKDLPGDFDLLWDMDGVDFAELDAVILDIDPPRTAQKLKYGGDILPNVIEGGSGMPFLDFFQQDPVTGRARGIVTMTLEVPR